MKNELIETWQIHDRINLYLLDGIELDEHLKDVASSKGRNVGEQFAHMHNVRLMWFQEAMPELLNNLVKIEKEEAVTIHLLKDHFIDSGKAVEELLTKSLEESRVKGFKPHPQAFLGYLISHESHHRGQIVLSLKQSGHPVSKKVGFGLWQWGTR